MRFVFLMIAGLALTLAAGPDPVAAEEADGVTLIHLNDVSELSSADGGGLVRAASVVRALEAEHPGALIVVSGDFLSPSLMGSITRGQHMVEAFNAIGVDFVSFGNHEFDFGSVTVEARMAESDFAWIGTNVLGDEGDPFIDSRATALVDVGGTKVGLIGLLTPDTRYLSSPGAILEITDPIFAAEEAVAALERQGAEIIVALTHLRVDEDRELAQAVPAIDLILGGHDHAALTVMDGSTLIHKSGADARHVGVVTLTPTGESVRADWRMVATGAADPDPAVADLIAVYEARMADAIDEPVGTTTTDLDTRAGTVRTGEAAFGNLVADAMVAFFNDVGMNPDVALMNGGGIRGNRTYAAGTEITRRDIMVELPFGNLVVLLEMSGADLLAALETGVGAVENGAGRFPQVSGLTFRFDADRPPGRRVQEVLVGGQPLDLARRYRVVTNNYLAGGGDTYEVFADAEAIVDDMGAPLLAGVVMDYVERAGTVSPTIQGRIIQGGDDR